MVRTKKKLGCATIIFLAGLVLFPGFVSSKRTTSRFDSLDTPNRSYTTFQQKYNHIKHKNVDAEYNNGKVRLKTHIITIQIAGTSNIPHFQFWPTSQNGTKYHAKFVSLVEYRDENEDDAFQNNETVKDPNRGAKRFAFPAAQWKFQGFYNITRNDRIIGYGFNFTMDGSYEARWNDLAVTITNRFFLEDVQETLHAGEKSATFNVSGLAALKTNILVENWPFESYQKTMLALRWDIHLGGAQHRARNRERRQNQHRHKLGNQKVAFDKQTQGNEKKVPPPQGEKSVALQFSAEEKSAQSQIRIPNTVKLQNRSRNRLEHSYCSYRTGNNKLKLYISAAAAKGQIIFDPIFEISRTAKKEVFGLTKLRWSLLIGSILVTGIATLYYVNRHKQ